MVKYFTILAMLIACLISCSSSSGDQTTESGGVEVQKTELPSATEDALAAAEIALAAAEDRYAAAEVALTAVEDDLAAAETALEATGSQLVAVEETAERASNDLEQARRDLEDAGLINQLLDEERAELRVVLDDVLKLANSLDDTKYPECNPVHLEDNSLFGIPTGTDMDDVISAVTERCGPPDPYIPMIDVRFDDSPDRDQWNSMCFVEDIWTSRVWQVGDRTITVKFYRTIESASEKFDTGWMFGWTGGDFPSGVQIGMTKNEITDALKLDPNRFYTTDLKISIDVTVDEAYRWGEGTGWGQTANTNGQPYNISLLYFKKDLFVGFGSNEFDLCQ